VGHEHVFPFVIGISHYGLTQTLFDVLISNPDIHWLHRLFSWFAH